MSPSNFVRWQLLLYFLRGVLVVPFLFLLSNVSVLYGVFFWFNIGVFTWCWLNDMYMCVRERSNHHNLANDIPCQVDLGYTHIWQPPRYSNTSGVYFSPCRGRSLCHFSLCGDSDGYHFWSVVPHISTPFIVRILCPLNHSCTSLENWASGRF